MAAIPRMVRGEGAVGSEDPALAPLEEGPMKFEHARLREDRVEPIAEIDTERSMAGMWRPHIWRSRVNGTPSANPPRCHLRRGKPVHGGDGLPLQIVPEKVRDPRLEPRNQVLPQRQRLLRHPGPGLGREPCEELRQRHVPCLFEKPWESRVATGAVVALVGKIVAVVPLTPLVLEDEDTRRPHRHSGEDGMQPGGDDEPGGGDGVEHRRRRAESFPGGQLATHQRRPMANARGPRLRQPRHPRQQGTDNVGVCHAGLLTQPLCIGGIGQGGG